MERVASLSGTVLGLGLSLAPVGAVREIQRRGSTGDVASLPFAACVVNGALWTAYGLLIDVFEIVFVNAVMVVANLYYLAVFQRNSKNSAALGQGLVAVTSSLVLLALALSVAESPRAASDAIGTMASVAAVIMFGSPLAELKRVLARRSARGMSLPFALVAALNCFSWTTLAILIEDVHIGIPNGIGLALALVQLAVIARYRDGPGLPL